MRALATVAFLLVCTVPAPFGGPAAADPAPASSAADVPETPTIVAVYPDPRLPGDRGEFVVIEGPPGAPTEALTLTDGETTVGVPAPGSGGRLAVATEAVVRNLTEVPVVLVGGRLRLANAGERIELRSGGRLVDAVTYPRARPGQLYRLTDAGWTWTPLGGTAFPVRTADDATVRTFALPDDPATAIEPLRTARRRLWLAAYTLTSPAVTEALCAARERGVDVRVLVELEPVGGLTRSQATQLDRLGRCAVPVRAIGGAYAPYTFHHAKYAVADDRAVVLTENWKPAGVGGRSSRGWGVVVESATVADALAATFTADSSGRAVRPWDAVRTGRSFATASSAANGTYPRVFTPSTHRSVGIEVLVAPDNAEARIVGLLEDAEASIRVIQVSVGGPQQPFVQALVRAARRGVEVRLLLADVWYVRESNRAVADTLNRHAREAALPLEVRLASPRGRYEKIHAKGAVIDGERVLVGSLNWNNVSARQNREVVLVLDGEGVGGYYARAFDADWQGGRWRVPATLPAVALLLALVGAAYAHRSIAFGSPSTDVGPPERDAEFREPY